MITTRFKFHELQTIAHTFYSSGYFKDCANEDQVLAKILAGQEMGFGPWASMKGIQVINGNPTLSAMLIAAMIKRDPYYDYKVIKLTEDEARLQFFEDGKPVGESAFTIADARRANLDGKTVWKQYPDDMLFSRALTKGAKKYCPTVSAGVPTYTPEEMGADADDVDVSIPPELKAISEPASKPAGATEPASDALANQDTFRELFEEVNRSFNPTNDAQLRKAFHERFMRIWVEELAAQGISGEIPLRELTAEQMASTEQRIRDRVLTAIARHQPTTTGTN